MKLRKRKKVGTERLMQSVMPLSVEIEESMVEGEGGTGNEAVSYETEPSKMSKVMCSGLPQ